MDATKNAHKPTNLVIRVGNTPETLKKEISATIQINREEILKVNVCSELKPTIISVIPKIKNKVGTEYFFKISPRLIIFY